MDYKVICFGEILWDNLKEGRRLGGAPLNVCYHLNKMGVKSTFISKLGNDGDGAAIRQELKRMGIDDRFCFTSDDMPTSTVEVKLSATHEVTYEILQNVAWDAIGLTKEMEDLVKAAAGFVYGSLVARSEVSRKTLLTLLPFAKYRVLDLNLRSPFYSQPLIEELLSYAHLLKLNEDELRKVSCWLGVKQEDTFIRLNAVMQSFPDIAEILFTRGENGAIYFSREKNASVEALKVNVQDTVGSGDSFLAAFLAGKFQGISIPDALRQAALLSGFVATQKGACPEYDAQMLAGLKRELAYWPSGKTQQPVSVPPKK